MTSFRMKLFALLLVLISVDGHGRLVSPMTRVGHSNYENSPVSSNIVDEFICRHEDALPPTVTWKAGDAVTLGFNFGVNHVGFCQGFLSYDWDKPRSEMRWFKIANFIDCADDFVSTASMDLPDWLPSGQAVFRWSWVALHLWPTPEFYCQCADIIIEGSQNAVELAEIHTYPVKGMLPASGTEGVGYANPYSGAETDRATGPMCAFGFDKNDCGLTTPGTAGYIDTGSDNTLPPVTTVPVSTSDPVTTVPVSTTSVETTLSPDTSTISTTTTPVTTTTSSVSTTTEGSQEGAAVNLCYFTNWARYRTGFMNVGKDAFEMGLDATLCTHINYGFGTIDPVTLELKAFDPNADYPNGAESQTTLCPDVCQPGYVHDWNTGANPCEWPCNPDRELRGFEGLNVGLKRQNPELKSILSVGGWNFNDCAFTGQSGQGKDSCEIFSNIASSEALSRQHAQKVVEFLRNWNFDGYDIDWEYPVVAGHNNLNMQATPDDYSNYIRMLRIIREEFELEAQTSGRAQLLLTAAVGVGKSTVEQAYDIAAMSEQLDLIGLMTYDLHGTWESVTGFNAPLYATAEDEAYFSYPVSVSWAVDYWLDHGARADQLLVGFASYGRGWKLADSSCTDPLCATSGECSAGSSTKLAGYLAFYEIEDLITSGSATKFYDNDRKAPYIVTSSGDWIGYDDVDSFREKLDFLKSKNLRGAMTWAIDLDDMSSYPLLNTLKDGLKEYRVDVATRSPTVAGMTFSPTVATTMSPTPQPIQTSSTTSTSVDPNCAGSWVSTESNVSNEWCVANCAVDVVWCSAYCQCDSDSGSSEPTGKPTPGVSSSTSTLSPTVVTTMSPTISGSTSSPTPSSGSTSSPTPSPTIAGSTASPTNSLSTPSPTKSDSTASPSSSTSVPSTTEENRTCSGRKYVSTDQRATDIWCQTNCVHDELWCLSTTFCACDDDAFVPTLPGAASSPHSSSAASFSSIMALLVLSCLV